MEKKDLDLDEARDKEREARKERAAKRDVAWAEKDRKQQEAQRKKAEKLKTATEKKQGKIKEPGLKEALENLPDDEWTEEEINSELQKKRDLRRVFKVIAKNQPVMKREIREYLNWKAEKKSHCDNMIDLLTEMKLVEEIKVLNIWAKNYSIKELGFKTKLTKEEKEVLNKFNSWSKTIQGKGRDKYIGVSGYWKLTEKGAVCVCNMSRSRR